MIKKLFILLFLAFAQYSFSQDTVKVATTLTPDQQAEADYNEGLERMKRSDFLTAVDYFTKSIVNRPDFEKAFYNRAVALTKLKRFNEAYADINKVIVKTPTNPEAYFTKSLIFFADNNKKDSQMVALNKCLAINPDHAEANYYKGLSLYESGEYAKAIENYNKAIAVKPEYTYAYNDRASAKRAMNDFAGAIADYEKAITLDDIHNFIFNNLGSAYRQNKNYTKAIEAYNKALTLDPKYLIAQLNRGAAKLEAGNFKDAQADFEDVLKKDPNNSSAFNGMASVYIKTKEYQKAKDLATKAIIANAKNGPAYYNRGIARQMLREEDGCCDDWKKAFDLGVGAAKSFINADCSQ